MTKLSKKVAPSSKTFAASFGAFLLAGCDTFLGASGAANAPTSKTEAPARNGSKPKSDKIGNIRVTLLCPTMAADVSFNGTKFGSSRIEKIDLDVSEPVKMNNGVSVSRADVVVSSQDNDNRADLTYQSSDIVAFSYSGKVFGNKKERDIVQINYVTNVKTGSFRRTASTFNAGISSNSSGICKLGPSS